MIDARPVLRDLVLVGGGHSHVVVMKMLAMQPLPGLRVTLICRDTDTPYSGMLHGYVTGVYGFDDVHIDLPRLAAFGGARFFRDEVVGLDRAGRRVLCANRPPVPYDKLSIDIGSTPRMSGVEGAEQHVVPIKPIWRFNQRWLALLARVRTHAGPLRVAVVGAGASGVEMTLAIQHRLRNELAALGRDASALSVQLVTGAARILPTHNARVRRHFESILSERGVAVHTGARVRAVADGQLLAEDGRRFEADEILWVTQAGGAAWLRDTGLALDDAGFIRVHPTLQSITDPDVFAAGDVASIEGMALEKAGVYAVREGPPLAANLKRAFTGAPLEPYRPQRRFLALISAGVGDAVASRGWWAARGGWVWRWKDRIDVRFMEKFNALTPMAMPAGGDAMGVAGRGPGGVGSPLALDAEETAQALSAIAMRCGGCGAKVGATVLSRALGALPPLHHDDVLIGLDAPDDAAVVRVPPGKAMVHTVDFFRAFIDDPYVFGRIAANHALGDIWAMGAQPQSATAVVTVPPGLERKVEDTLFQMMSGARAVLDEAGCALVGGHTGEGAELAFGFAINGLIDEHLRGVLRKGGMRAGDLLVLTKPIGTGTLLVALPRLAARGRWIDAALSSMMRSNRVASEVLRAHGATSCTDLTGFGLLGHLVEMLRPSGVDAELDLAALPVLEGAEQTAAAGLLSSLQPANVRLRRALRNQADYVEHPRYRLLFDPQTAGGLLASVPAAEAPACLAALHAGGDAQACVIGRVLPQGDAIEPVVLRG